MKESIYKHKYKWITFENLKLYFIKLGYLNRSFYVLSQYDVMISNSLTNKVAEYNKAKQI